MPMLVGNSSALASLASLTAVNLASHGPTAAEAGFVMTKVQLNLVVEGTNLNETQIREQQSWALVLAPANVDAAGVKATMALGIFDQTPADGDDNLGQFQLDQRNIVRILYPKIRDTVIIHELASNEYAMMQSLFFEGAPLDNTIDGRGSPYTFPKGVGWQWFLWNYGSSGLDGSLLTDFQIKHWGKWIK